MKVAYGSTLLAGGLMEGTNGFTLNGQQVNEPVDFIRALQRVFYPGVRSAVLAFAVTKTFETLHAAARFALEHFANLPEQADLKVYIGTEADGEWVSFPDAVIDVVPASVFGVAPSFQYQFSVGAPLFEQSAPSLLEPDTDMLKRGSEAIDDGEDEVEITFSVPFGATPGAIAVSVEVPDDGDVIHARVKRSTKSATGFTALLSAPVPSAGYYLAWIANA